ncbi:unnamed protein product [Calypogeia fissa]
MAPWALMKLLHPFTPDDLLESQRRKSSLNLEPSTSQFVLALSSSRAPEKVVYVLSVEKLSERSIGDIHRLVAAVNPSSVVAFVDAQYLTGVVEEGKLLESPEGFEVPTSYFDLIRNCFLEKIKAGVYESRARLKVLISIFGTTFYGNVLAARRASEETQAVFEYLCIPSTATSSFSVDKGDEVDGGASEGEAGGSKESSYAHRFLTLLSGLLGRNDSEHLTGVPTRVTTSPYLTLPSEELAYLAPNVASSVPSKLSAVSISPAHSSGDISSSANNLSEVSDDCCPSFAAPFYPLFLDLHQLFAQSPGVNEALKFSRKVLDSVERGDGVDHEDLSRARLFRVAVESVRLCWNSFVRQERRVSSRPADFTQLPFEEKCQALLAHALQDQAQKFNTVVAIVDSSMVPGVRRHWNTPIPPEVAAYAEYCFVDQEVEENGEGSKTFKILDNPETKAAVVVSAGAVAAAGLISLPHWASVPTFMKVFSFKVPTVLKLVFFQLKRQAFVSSATPASNLMMPALKAAGLVPSSGAKAMILKSIATAEKAKAVAHGVVGAVEKASLQAIRTAFYSLMRNRQTNNLGPRPWLVLGGCLTAAAGVLLYGEEVEHAIGILPSAPAVIRLGRGLEKLEQASGKVDDYEGSIWWDRVYETLYRNPKRF